MGDVITTLQFHGTDYFLPYVSLMPALTDEEKEQLEADIEKRGVLVPVVIDENNNVIDGHHRLTFAIEHNLKQEDVPFEIRPGLSEAEKHALARDLNLHRRHLDKKQRQELVAQMRSERLSYGIIGEKLGVSDETARLDDKSVAKNLVTDYVKGKDGKKYPAKKKPRYSRRGRSVFTTNQKQAAELTELMQKSNVAALPIKTLDKRRAARVLRENLPVNNPGENSPALLPSCDVRLGKFQQVLADLPGASVDLIFTDPPYGKKYLGEWLDLSLFAARVLKPGGLLIAYSGQYYLPEVMSQLTQHLEYVWLGAIKTHGPKNINQIRKMYGKCKPLLFYSKGDYAPLNFVDDFIDDDKPEKGAHDWQQGIKPALYYIELLTSGGGTVADPFLGSGTTGVAALKLGRSFVGAEKEQKTYKDAMNRIAKELA